jgi:hypothetical protein
VPTGGTGTVSIFNVSFPNHIQIWNTVIMALPSNVNDRVSISVAPNTTIGYLTAPVSSGTVLSVPPATVQSPYVLAGAVLTLIDTVNAVQQEVGYLLAIDKNAYQLTVQTAVNQSFPAGTLVQMTIYMMRDYRFVLDGQIQFGGKGLKAKQVPANTPVRVEYTNNSTAGKTFNVHVEHYKY